MSYKGIFNPNDIELFGVPRPATEGKTHRVGDRGDESVYVYADGIALAVNVALATDRPLLVRGVSGSGKSSLAKNVAKTLNWRYYEAVVTSRTQARDLLWNI